MTIVNPNQINQIVDWAIELQQVPAPTFGEHQRAEYLDKLFVEAGIKSTEFDTAGNLYGHIPGGNQPPVVICAHLDTVHSSKQKNEISRTTKTVTGPGIGDNALGLALLVHLAELFQKPHTLIPGEIILVGTVCEEGLGNLKGIRQVAERFGNRPHCYVILEGIGLGQIQQKALGATRLRIQVQSPGGHSWSDYGNPSAIHELINIAAHIQAIQLPSSPRTTLNIGVIRGGSAINAIAQSACMELDLRSEDQEALANLVSEVQAQIEIARQNGIMATVEEIGNRPSGMIAPDDPFLQFARKTLQELGINPRMNISSTDASLLIQKQLPVISIGITTGSNVHSINETIEINPISTGLKQLYAILAGIWDIQREKAHPPKR